MQKHYNYLTIDLDRKIYNTLNAIQSDSKSRYILVNLVSNNLAYDLTGTSVKIYGIKKDKTIFFNSATIIDTKNGQFEIELTNQALATTGYLKIQILVTGANQERLTTSHFFINVNETIVNDTAIESTNEFTALTNALSEVQDIDNKFTKVNEQFISKASKQELELQKNRIDNLAKLTEGSTTGDAELIDGRIGADGVIYENIGNGIRSQFSNIVTYTKKLSKNIINLSNTSLESKGCTLSVIDEVITLNGTATATTDLNLQMNMLEDGQYTFKYEILEGTLEGTLKFYYLSETGFDIFSTKETIITLSGMNRSKIRLLTGTKCNDLKIHLWAWKGDTIGEFEPYGQYTNVKLNNDVLVEKAELSYNLSLNTHETTNKNKAKIDNYLKLNEIEATSEDNKFIWVNKEVKDATGFRIDKFKLLQGEKLNLTCVAGANVVTIAKWDEGYNIILDNICVATAREQQNFSYIATEKEEFISVCGRTREGEFRYYKEIEPVMKINKYMTSYIDDMSYNNLFSSYYFKGLNGIAIGDSLTYGVVDGTTGSSKNTNKNYPYWLSKMLDCTIEVDGYPGIDAMKYWNTYGINKNYSNYDFAIIFLGTNYGLTNTLAVDTSNLEYNNTDTGCYCKLIEKIKQDNPKCKILLCKPYITVGDSNIKTVSSKETTNKVISQISDKYNLIDINLDVKPFNATYKDGIIHQFDKTHLGVGGYLLLASEMAKKISQQIVNNINFINDTY